MRHVLSPAVAPTRGTALNVGVDVKAVIKATGRGESKYGISHRSWYVKFFGEEEPLFLLEDVSAISFKSLVFKASHIDFLRLPAARPYLVETFAKTRGWMYVSRIVYTASVDFKETFGQYLEDGGLCEMELKDEAVKI